MSNSINIVINLPYSSKFKGIKALFKKVICKYKYVEIESDLFYISVAFCTTFLLDSH